MEKMDVEYEFDYDYFRTASEFELYTVFTAFINGQIDPDYFNIHILDNLLHDMVNESKSHDTEEEKRQWHKLIPLMKEDQKMKLLHILGKRRDRLGIIEAKYDSKKLGIKQKYLDKWKAMAEEKSQQNE